MTTEGITAFNDLITLFCWLIILTPIVLAFNTWLAGKIPQ
jgi:hypothetical protein